MVVFFAREFSILSLTNQHIKETEMIKNLNFTITLLMLSAMLSPIYADSRITIENVGFATPESVEYYAAEDVYLVTNINGSPLEADGNGFISKVSPDGKVIDLKWIDGTNANTNLNAPKGAAIQGDILYVADLDEVHLFQLPDGKQINSVRIKGSTFLNGITPSKEPFVYVTDSGLKGGEGGFVPSGTDAIYRVSNNGKYKTIAKGIDMGRPNGIIVEGNDFTVVTFGSSEIFHLGMNGNKRSIPAPPSGALDGLLKMDDGSYLISSWGGSAIYQLDQSGNYSVVADSLDAPADIGYDSRRNRILVPLFKQNKVVIVSP